ncbi:O-antigen ligase family protein [Lacticaseibacillus camelliae]|uniref:O-antigen ligase-related domain-containing protein n=1 Tax=Lacticaseibacillus camelliae DSM 22697 = JCM 13995 TaxID=1423730 RepID=A0A0R2EZ09_9LACO|nr:O-antigen ligase family protein [Lacticaseibacillus camelliae]KRN21634.1 hypothetical protein FC75_GL002153 [Lacticaseibacillus camelliae DSM 22697 = JCM 13995]
MQRLIGYNKPLTRIFILSFEIALLLRMNILESLVSSKFDSALFAIVALFGALVVLTNLAEWFTNREIPNVWLVLIILAMVVSTLLVPEASLISNGKMVIWQVLYFFAVFYVGKHEDPQLLRWFENILFVYWTISVIGSLFLFFVNYSYTASLSKIYYGVRIGMVQNRLYGFFVEPNFAANLSDITILLMMNRAIKAGNRARVGYCVLMAIQFLYVVLSGSRSAMLNLSLVTFIGLFLVFRYQRRFDTVFVKWLKSLGVALLGVLLVVGLSEGVKVVMPHLVVPTKIILLDKMGSQTTKKNSDVSLEREDITENGDTSNGRLSLWKSALEIGASSPVYGGSPRNFINYARKELPHTYISYAGQTPHNLFLLTLVSTGLMGLIPLVGFLIEKFWLLAKNLFKARGLDDISFIIFGLIVVDMFVFGCVMPDVIFENRIGAFCFWLFLGVVSFGPAPEQDRLEM